jgi:hypothetical protein
MDAPKGTMSGGADTTGGKGKVRERERGRETIKRSYYPGKFNPSVACKISSKHEKIWQMCR